MTPPFIYGNGLQIVVPEDAVRVTVFMRHSDSVQEGDNDKRTLNLPRGVDICRDVMPELNALTSHLAAEFSAPFFFHSGWPRSYLTLFLATGAEQILQHPNLATTISSKRFPYLGENNAFRFMTEQSQTMGWTRAQTLAAMAATLRNHYHGEIAILDPIHASLLNCRDFITGYRRCQIAVGHENAISLTAALAGAPDDQLGLKWCQAFVFFVDAKGQIINVQKFTPTATLDLPDE